MRGSRKLRLAPLWPALAALGVMAVSLAFLLPPLIERSVGNQLLDSLHLVEDVIAAEMVRDQATAGDVGEAASDVGGASGRGEPRPSPALQDFVTSLAADTDVRVTVISPGGTVLADSDRTWQQLQAMDDHNRRPEVVAARRDGEGRATRRSDTTGRRYVYTAATFRLPAGGEAEGGRAGAEPTAADDAAYVLRLAQPLEDLHDVLRRLVQAALLAFLATLAAIAVLSVWLDRRLLQPLADLIDGAGSLATGRHPGQRLEVPQQRDLAELATAMNRLTERVEEQIATVEKERDYLSTILSSMSEGVLVVDGEGRAVLTNPAFRRLFGLARDVEGRTPLELARHPELATVVERTLAEGSARIEEMILDSPPHTAGSAPRTVFLAGAALRRTGGGRSAGGRADGGRAGRNGGAPEEPGGVVVARDTTEATRLTQMRRDFVANVSHELKTPLSAIRGYAETLRDGALDEPEAARRFTGRILEQCRRLQALLDDLLVLSRLESVEIPLAQEPVNVTAVAERCLETVAAAAAERGISLVYSAPGSLPAEELPEVTGDRGALERLLLNLLENAIKYNRPDGEVRLRIAESDRSDPNGVPVIEIEVADTGIGIPAESMPRLFERFYRVDKGRARDEGGTGLGLAIVKHVAQAHGGRVGVRSRPGTGSIFRVLLPATGTRRFDPEHSGVWRRD